MTDKHKLEQLIDSLMERDRLDVSMIENTWNSGGWTIENRIELADSRAKDALMAVMVLARYIMEKEKEHD